MANKRTVYTVECTMYSAWSTVYAVECSPRGGMLLMEIFAINDGLHHYRAQYSIVQCWTVHYSKVHYPIFLSDVQCFSC